MQNVTITRVATVVIGAALLTTLGVRAQQRSADAAAVAPAMTALDYVEIEQLVAKYARTVVSCVNSGYDYADLYAEDGWFAPTRDGRVTNKWQGRERLAEAAGGGKGGCKDVAWNGVTHILANHVIAPAPEGAHGEVDLIAVGVDGDPHKVEGQGHYEDVYVRTPRGWRFQSRTHHLVVRQSAPPPASGK